MPGNRAYYFLNYEGADDMPAHIKANSLGNNLTPHHRPHFGLGLWQGIVLGEHRVTAESLQLIVTICGK